jgi:hypothetical protein
VNYNKTVGRFRVLSTSTLLLIVELLLQRLTKATANLGENCKIQYEQHKNHMDEFNWCMENEAEHDVVDLEQKPAIVVEQLDDDNESAALLLDISNEVEFTEEDEVLLYGGKSSQVFLPKVVSFEAQLLYCNMKRRPSDERIFQEAFPPYIFPILSSCIVPVMGEYINEDDPSIIIQKKTTGIRITPRHVVTARHSFPDKIDAYWKEFKLVNMYISLSTDNWYTCYIELGSALDKMFTDIDPNSLDLLLLQSARALSGYCMIPSIPNYQDIQKSDAVYNVMVMGAGRTKSDRHEYNELCMKEPWRVPYYILNFVYDMNSKYMSFGVLVDPIDPSDDQDTRSSSESPSKRPRLMQKHLNYHGCATQKRMAGSPVVLLTYDLLAVQQHIGHANMTSLSQENRRELPQENTNPIDLFKFSGVHIGAKGDHNGHVTLTSGRHSGKKVQCCANAFIPVDNPAFLLMYIHAVASCDFQKFDSYSYFGGTTALKQYLTEALILMEVVIQQSPDLDHRYSPSVNRLEDWLNNYGLDKGSSSAL